MASDWRTGKSLRWWWWQDATVFELRVRSGFRRLPIYLALDHGRLWLDSYRHEPWFTLERQGPLLPKDLGRLADLTPDSSSLFADICERLQEDGWTDGRDARVAHHIVDKIVTLAKEREQRLLALPPAAQIRWTALTREDQWNANKRGALETINGSLEVSLHYQWEPRLGGGASAHWVIERAKAGGSRRPLSTSGRVPLGDVCCDQAVGDLEDWGWPRPESLGIGRALAEQALRDWNELKPERARQWKDVGL